MASLTPRKVVKPRRLSVRKGSALAAHRAGTKVRPITRVSFRKPHKPRRTVRPVP